MDCVINSKLILRKIRLRYKFKTYIEKTRLRYKFKTYIEVAKVNFWSKMMLLCPIFEENGPKIAKFSSLAPSALAKILLYPFTTDKVQNQGIFLGGVCNKLSKIMSCVINSKVILESGFWSTAL